MITRRGKEDYREVIAGRLQVVTEGYGEITRGYRKVTGGCRKVTGSYREVTGVCREVTVGHRKISRTLTRGYPELPRYYSRREVTDKVDRRLFAAMIWSPCCCSVPGV